MDNVVSLAERRKVVIIDGVRYVSCSVFCERMGVGIETVYQWRYHGRLPFVRKYLGRLVFEERAIDLFKKSSLERMGSSR